MASRGATPSRSSSRAMRAASGTAYPAGLTHLGLCVVPPPLATTASVCPRSSDAAYSLAW